MYIAIDVYYYEDHTAKAVSIEFDQWEDESPRQSHVVLIKDIAPYVPGEFYKRELPCILKVLEQSEMAQVDAIIVDGYVVLDDDGKLGLGGYLYEALNKSIPIIGVAKKSFHQNQKNVIPILRGESNNPLFITSLGIPLQEAANKIQHMKGAYRFPQLLKILDQKTRE